MNNELVDWVEIYEDANEEFRWRAKSNNGNTLAVSGEGYENRLHAENMVAGMFPGKEVKHIEEMAED
jgi:uncharacterized protein YegP (UPF0339 family)